MGNFNRGGFGRGRRSFGGDRNFGGRNYDRGDRGDRQMFKAVCSNCGKDCEVPFKPTGEKPVYCSDCFEKMGKKDDRGSFDRPRHSDRGLEMINAKLDKILDLLQSKKVTERPPHGAEVEEPVENREIKSRKSKKSSKEKSPEEIEQVS